VAGCARRLVFAACVATATCVAAAATCLAAAACLAGSAGLIGRTAIARRPADADATAGTAASRRAATCARARATTRTGPRPARARVTAERATGRIIVVRGARKIGTRVQRTADPQRRRSEREHRAQPKAKEQTQVPRSLARGKRRFDAQGPPQ